MGVVYKDIVGEWYYPLRGGFIGMLMERFKGASMSVEDAEDIYQEVFLAIGENFLKGKVKEDSSWKCYIMKVGINMACKRYRRERVVVSGADTDLSTLADEREESPYDDPELLGIVDDEMARLPEKQANLIRLYYHDGLKDSEIAGREGTYSSTATVKVMRNRCLDTLSRRVRERAWMKKIS